MTKDNDTSGTAVLETTMAVVILANLIVELGKLLAEAASGKPVTMDDLRARVKQMDQADAQWQETIRQAPGAGFNVDGQAK